MVGCTGGCHKARGLLCQDDQDGNNGSWMGDNQRKLSFVGSTGSIQPGPAMSCLDLHLGESV